MVKILNIKMTRLVLVDSVASGDVYDDVEDYFDHHDDDDGDDDLRHPGQQTCSHSATLPLTHHHCCLPIHYTAW